MYCVHKFLAQIFGNFSIQDETYYLNKMRLNLREKEPTWDPIEPIIGQPEEQLRIPVQMGWPFVAIFRLQ